MTRTQMYDFIKTNCLKDEVRRVFGVNYSSVSNADLEDFLKGFSATTHSNKTAVTYNIVDEYKAAIVVMLTYLKSVGKLDEVLKLVNM